MKFQDYKKAEQIVYKRNRLFRLINFFEQGVEAKEKFYNGDMRNIAYDPGVDFNKKYPYSVDINSDELNIIRKSLLNAMTQCDIELSKI